MASTSDQSIRAEVHRYESLPKFLKVICLVLFAAGIGLAVFYMWGFSIQGRILESCTYYYLLFACFAATVFLTMPMHRTEKHRTKIPWYDVVLAAVVFGSCVYFATESWSISRTNWAPPPTILTTVLAGIIILVALESGRRIAGLPLIILCVVIGFYPLVAEHMPGLLFGKSFSLHWLLGAFAYSSQGMLGLPARVIAEILIGFLVFAGVLIALGGGRFFLDLALSLLGRFRGGPAKVAVVASGFFGSLTGSPMTNVVGTGSFTIPAMKRIGYPANYAGAIEAVASTGGMIMPPVMGTVAFVMAELADVPYAEVMVAAFIPAVLYYWGLVVQVDAYAARVGLKGLPREECPPVWSTLKGGWTYIVVLAFLVFGLIYMRWEARAPFYATGLMLLLSFTSRETMMTPRRMLHTLATMGNLITFLIGILLPIGFIMIGLQATGSLTALTAQIVTIAGTTNVAVVLIIAFVISYLFGMIGLAIVPYIVLAVTVVPALVIGTGLDLLGLHLFLLYFLLIAGITPPVATTAFVAAALAGSPPMKTAFTSMRLGVVIYFVPFFFVFTPALLLHGPILESVYYFALALVGIWLLGSGVEGYLLRVGKLSMWARPLLFVGGFLFAFPEWKTTVIGVALSALVVVIMLIRKKMVAAKLRPSG